MNTTVRNTIRQLAESTILHMELLKESLNSADFHEMNAKDLKAIVEQQAMDLEFARDRIQQDEATIQLKDNEIQSLQAGIESIRETRNIQKLKIEQLEEEKIRNANTIESHEITIDKLKRQTQASPAPKGVSEYLKGETNE